MIDDLYSARILGLAANLPHAGRLASPDGTGERVARLCGSRAVVDVVLDDQGRVAEAQKGGSPVQKTPGNQRNAGFAMIQVAGIDQIADGDGGNG